jgi:DNA-binding MarR family transcriptional regulator
VTSQEAAEAMDPRGQHLALLEAFGRIGPANLSVIAEAAGLTEHQASRRLSELERMGHIRWDGTTTALGPTGRRQRVLELVRGEVPA